MERELGHEMECDVASSAVSEVRGLSPASVVLAWLIPDQAWQTQSSMQEMLSAFGDAVRSLEVMLTESEIENLESPYVLPHATSFYQEVSGHDQDRWKVRRVPLSIANR